MNDVGAGALYTRQTHAIRGNFGAELTNQSLGTFAPLTGGRNAGLEAIPAGYGRYACTGAAV